MINDREDWTEMEHEKADIKKRMQYILNMRPVFNKEALFSDGTEYYRIPAEPKAGVNEIKQKLSIGYGKELPIGSSLEIMYEENNPKRILILENNPQKKLYIIFIIVGISSLIAGLIICIL